MTNEHDIASVAIWRIEKAEDELRKAQLFLDMQEYSEVMVKCYYAVFHAMQAINIFKISAPQTHKGTGIVFRKEFVKTGLIEREASLHIAKLQRLREQADYEDFFKGTEEDAKDAFDKADAIIAQIKVVLNE